MKATVSDAGGVKAARVDYESSGKPTHMTLSADNVFTRVSDGQAFIKSKNKLRPAATDVETAAVNALIKPREVPKEAEDTKKTAKK